MLVRVAVKPYRVMQIRTERCRDTFFTRLAASVCVKQVVRRIPVPRRSFCEPTALAAGPSILQETCPRLAPSAQIIVWNDSY